MTLLGALVVTLGCSSLGGKMGKMEQFVGPNIDGSKIDRIAMIAGGSSRGDMQVLARARERMTEASFPVVRRPGSWETNADAVRDICVQTAGSEENVDGVVFVSWDRLVLHDCASKQIATEITGNYVGIDKMVETLLRYLGVTPPAEG